MPGRRYTGTSAESVSFATALSLAGFDFRYGTVAAWVNIVSFAGGSGFGVLVCTNGASGACIEYGPANTSPTWDYWDGSNDRTVAGPATGVTCLMGLTKATGTQTPRGHLWVPSTNAKTHTALNGTSVDSAAVTALCMGNESAAASSPSGPFNGEMWEVAMWNKVVMSDSEWERLTTWKDWCRFAPDFHHRESDRRETGDVARTMGRFKVKQSARTGTTRGTLAEPPGFGSSAVRRRS